MADRYLSDLEDDNFDRRLNQESRQHSNQRRRKRRIRVTQNGMPDSLRDESDETLDDTIDYEDDRPIKSRTREHIEYENNPEYETTPVDESPHFDSESGRSRDYNYDEQDEIYDEQDDEPIGIEPRRAVRPVRQRESYHEPRSHHVAPRQRARRPLALPDRMPQLPIRGGLSDLVGRGRVAMTVLMGLLAFIGYNVANNKSSLTQTPTTPTQSLSLSAAHDVALGRKSSQQIVATHGGISKDQHKRSIVQQIGARLVNNSDAGKSAYRFSFDVLADERSIGAFALPGGQIFLTGGLYDQLTTQGEIAGILAHEIAHVTQRHGVARLANASLPDGNKGAVVMASFLDPTNYKPTRQDVTRLIAETVQLRYDPAEVQESDRFALHYLEQAKFDPSALLTALQRVALIDNQMTHFALRHRAPQNQLVLIQQQIESRFPNGVPTDFIP